MAGTAASSQGRADPIASARDRGGGRRRESIAGMLTVTSLGAPSSPARTQPASRPPLRVAAV
ncbi:hypothetical protein, partial [Frankia sp. AgKG'84/4]|uniref:hypothetical protein n=1 Tax=Frankia sp. AgKG'84/4 TaxID=573490 RepID=UPI00202A9A06